MSRTSGEYEQSPAPRTRKRRKKRRKNRAGSMMHAVSYLVFVLGVSLIISGFGIYIANDMFALVKPEKTAMLELSEDTTHGEVAKMLKKEGIIRCRWAFTLYANFSNEDKTFDSGKYEVKNDVLGGVYSDGKPFGSTYDIAFDESGNTLTLTSATGVAETGVYVRAAIPDGVKNGAAVMKSSRTVPIRLL